MCFLHFCFAFDRAFWVNRGTREKPTPLIFFILYAGVMQGYGVTDLTDWSDLTTLRFLKRDLPMNNSGLPKRDIIGRNHVFFFFFCRIRALVRRCPYSQFSYWSVFLRVFSECFMEVSWKVPRIFLKTWWKNWWKSWLLLPASIYLVCGNVGLPRGRFFFVGRTFSASAAACCCCCCSWTLPGIV